MLLHWRKFVFGLSIGSMLCWQLWPGLNFQAVLTSLMIQRRWVLRLCGFSDITAIIGVGKVRFISIEKESEAFFWLICSELMRETANGLYFQHFGEEGWIREVKRPCPVSPKKLVLDPGIASHAVPCAVTQHCCGEELSVHLWPILQLQRAFSISAQII